MARFLRNFALSLAIHALLLLVLISKTERNPEKRKAVFSVTIENDVRPETGHHAHGGFGGKKKIDLRPGFAKGAPGLFAEPHSPGRGSPGNDDAQDLLAVSGKTLQAFDQLALMVNGHLDYPEALSENGVQGLATLDLYFDHSARVDESRSQFRGDNRLVRGLLVRAARKGVADWFLGDGVRLARDQFRDQHFRVDFIITYTSTQSSELEKTGEGSYHLTRRSLIQTCLNPAIGAVDVTCVAARVAGAISREVSEKYKIKYQALKDQLEAFDQMNLRGINEEISRRS